MAKETILYKKTTGLNYNLESADMEWSGTGECELVECVNTYISKTGKLSRALGNTLEVVFQATPHTVFDAGDCLLIGVGNVLYKYAEDTGPVSVKDNCSGYPIVITAYAGTYYCCDGVSCFKLRGTTVSSWAFTAKYGAKTHKVYASPVVHTKSFAAYGRIFILVSGILFYTDPIGPDMFCYAENVIWDQEGIIDCFGINGVIVIGTAKNVYILTGEDFQQIKRTVVSLTPLIPNTLASGFFGTERVVCFTLENGMHAVASGSPVVKVTENRVPVKFFEDKTFTGATVLNARYSVIGSTEAYTVDLQTKALEKHTVPFSKVSGRFGVSGLDVRRLETGVLADVTKESKVTFQAFHFNTDKFKSFRRLDVRGKFNANHSWKMTDNFGNTVTVVKTGVAGAVTGLHTVPGNTTVKGQLLTIEFTTTGDFSLNELSCLPLIAANRRI